MKSTYQSIMVLLISTFFFVVRGHNKCVDLTIPVTVTAESLTTAFAPFQNSWESTAFIDRTVARVGTSSPLSGTKTVTDTFSISGQYCTPTGYAAKKNTLQILTHGLGFDKSYWDFTLVPGNYSYVKAATEAGYSTFAYDRLGNGLSTKADPYNIVQAPIEVAILAKITQMLRAGEIPGCNTYAQYVHVGHSYGSVLTNSFVSSSPDLSDGLILTGYSNNHTYEDLFISTVGRLARQNQPARFGALSTGYITWGDVYENQRSFYAYPYFDTAVVIAAESSKWPVTAGELVSTSALEFAAPGFRGPVLFLAAQYDLIFCGGDCTDIIDGPYSISRTLFPAASSFEVYIQPNVAHAINLHYNATGAFEVGNRFLERNGL